MWVVKGIQGSRMRVEIFRSGGIWGSRVGCCEKEMGE